MAYIPPNPNGQATKANSQPVTLASDQELALPTGASTSAKQDTGNTSLGNIDTTAGTTTDAAATAGSTGTISAKLRNISATNDAAATSVAAINTKMTDGTQKVIAAGDVAAAGTDSGNPVKVGGKYNATQPTYTDGQRGDLQIDSRGNVKVALMPFNSNTSMKNIADNADGVAASSTVNWLGVLNRNTVYNGTTWDRQLGNSTDGTQVYIKGTASDNGMSATKIICAASTNATSIKGSAGKVYMVTGFNSDTVGYWVKFYNKASSPTVGTDVPVVAMYAPPGGGFVVPLDLGGYYSSGIAFAATLNATDADSTAVTNANKLVINVRYA